MRSSLVRVLACATGTSLVANVRTACVATAVALTAVGTMTGCGSTGSKTTSGSLAGHRGGTFTILAHAAFGVADPARNYTLGEWQLLINTHDGLVQFKRVGGVPGTQIVPDLATAIPTPTDGGKTYTFQIRKGIKFSNGAVMKPSDFVTTFERQFTVPGPTCSTRASSARRRASRRTATSRRASSLMTPPTR